MDDMAVKRHKIIAQAARVVATMCDYTLFVYRRAGRTPPITYGPLAERDKIRIDNLRFIFHNDDRHCVEQLRMRRVLFFTYAHCLGRLLRDTINSSVEEQVAMFLQVVGHNCRFRLIELNFKRDLETISCYFQEVLYAIGELRGEIIRPPSHEVHPKIANSCRFNPYFKDCIGAIDGTHVLARVPASMAATFQGRKGVTTQNVMAAVLLMCCINLYSASTYVIQKVEQIKISRSGSPNFE